MAKPRLGRQFYDVSGEDLATALLGQTIVRMVNGTRLSARIVETEAYLGAVDKAAHSYKGQTDRNQAMFMQPGTAYVYSIYGMHYCFNISSRGAGCAVLIRSVEPLEGVEKMGELRKVKKKSPSASPTPTASFKVHQLTNGPAKLCQALAISKQQLNQHDLVTDTEMWLEEGGGVSTDCVVVSARINIAYAEEWTDKPLRFYVLHNPCVSVRNKAAEKLLETSGLKTTTTEKAKVTSTQKAKITSTQKAKITSTQKAKITSAQKDKITSSEKQGFTVKTANNTAVHSKLGKRKVKASSVGDQTETAVVAAKSAKKDEGTTSPYFSKT